VQQLPVDILRMRPDFGQHESGRRPTAGLWALMNTSGKRICLHPGSGVGTHADMRTLFTDDTLWYIAPLASFVHNMMETSVDEQHGIAST
jgi:hypothetical protein